jgi:hypothetical protein
VRSHGSRSVATSYILLSVIPRELVRNHGSRSVVTSYTPPLVILRGLVRSHGTRFVTTSCTPHSAILRELALSADLCSAAIPLLGTPGWRFPWMVRAPAQESHRSAVASRMSLG